MKTNEFLFCPSCQELFQVDDVETVKELSFFLRKKDTIWVFPDQGPIKTLPKLLKQYPTMMRGVASFCVYQILRCFPYPDLVYSLAAFEERDALDLDVDSQLLAQEIAKIFHRPMKKESAFFSPPKTGLSIQKQDLHKEILFVGSSFQEEIIKTLEQEGSFIKKRLCFLVKKEGDQKTKK
jgi:hypothetical protein